MKRNTASEGYDLDIVFKIGLLCFFIGAVTGIFTLAHIQSSEPRVEYWESRRICEKPFGRLIVCEEGEAGKICHMTVETTDHEIGCAHKHEKTEGCLPGDVNGLRLCYPESE